MWSLLFGWRLQLLHAPWYVNSFYLKSLWLIFARDNLRFPVSWNDEGDNDLGKNCGASLFIYFYTIINIYIFTGSLRIAKWLPLWPAPQPRAHRTNNLPLGLFYTFFDHFGLRKVLICLRCCWQCCASCISFKLSVFFLSIFTSFSSSNLMYINFVIVNI